MMSAKRSRQGDAAWCGVRCPDPQSGTRDQRVFERGTYGAAHAPPYGSGMGKKC
eukprot:NODE_4955_length_626_cov_237.197898.p5 GENE.NODE_4955_length_626_cov_237.197898~~NODE_4955_length_626_cov_237.197898.p5  ORF type:complete len:54 (-),score=0.70 NODE_4955_length_626_cov_237.197898:290-451(-)